MADITVTAADVRPLVGATVRRFEAGGTIDIGAPVYIADDGDVEETDGSLVATAWAIGLAVSTPDGGTSAAAGEYVDVVTRGPVAGFSSQTPGTLVYVNDTAGACATTAGTNSFIIGYAESATTVYVRPETIHLTEQS